VNSEFFQLAPLQIAVAILAIVLAYTIKGLSGFGAGLIAIPLLSLVLPITIVVPAVSLLSYGGNLIQSFSLRRQASWRDLWPLMPFSALGVILAVWLLVNIDPRQLALAMGLFVIAYALYSLLPLQGLAGSRLWAIPFGSLGGFIGALFGSSGFIYVVYLKLRPLDKAGFRASVAMGLALDGTFRISGYITSGLFNTRVLTLVAILFPVLLLSMKAGNYLHLNISPARFNQIVSVLLMVSGVMLVYKSI
jgi:uncharacterized membrane protein YfcA